MDTVTRVSHQSYGSRLGNSCKSLAVAPILLVIGIWLLVWNEGNSITQHKAFEEGLKIVMHVETDAIDSENEGQLVHFIGTATTETEIADTVFGVAPDDALKLKRTVEMYQWIETKKEQTKKNTGGSTETVTTYTYSKAWREDHISSATFEEPEGHTNPDAMLYSTQVFVSDPIYVGAFQLPGSITSMMNWFQPITTTLSTDTIQGDDAKSNVQVSNNGFYYGTNPSSPTVGDLRVTFSEVRQQTISVVAKQVGSSLSTYTTSNGGSVLLLEPGTHDPEEMFLHANEALTMQTWFLRVAGFFIIFLAFNTVLEPLSVVADVIPFIGDIISGANCCVAMCLAAVVASITIAIAWLAYRPIFSGILLACVVGGIIAMKKFLGGKGSSSSRGIPEAQAYEMPVGRFKDEENMFSDE